jgi:microcompartment protein CcmK/EutM
VILARVIGTVVQTEKHPSYRGEKLLVVEPVDTVGKSRGRSWLAVDKAQAGVGDTVLVMREGSGVRQILGREKGIPVEQAVKMEVPIRSLIVGIVDAAERSIS